MNQNILNKISKDILLFLIAIATYVFAFLYQKYISRNFGMIFLSFFYIALIESSAYILKYRFKTAYLIWAAIILLQSFSYEYINSFGPLKYLFIHASVIYYTMYRYEKLAVPFTSGTILLDFFAGWIIQPFAHFFSRIIYIMKFAKKHIRSNFIKLILISLILLIPSVLFVLSQLSGIDASFAKMTSTLWRILQDMLESYISVEFILSLPIGAYLFGLIYSCIEQKRPFISYNSCRKFVRNSALLPAVSLRIITVVLLLIYILFFGFQLSELPSVLASPTAQSACIYAVSGFWNFFRIMGLNIILLLAINFLTSNQNSSHYKIDTFVLLFAILCFNLLACFKLGLYITFYGITERRMIAAWLLISIFISLLLIFARMHKEFHLVEYIVYVFIMIYLVMIWMPEPQYGRSFLEILPL